jgi:hypothetical protein
LNFQNVCEQNCATSGLNQVSDALAHLEAQSCEEKKENMDEAIYLSFENFQSMQFIQLEIE